MHAFGPGAEALAAEVAGHIRTWAAYRRGRRPSYRIYPAGTPDDALDLPTGRSRVIDKAHSRVTISWPPAADVGGGQGVPQDPA